MSKNCPVSKSVSLLSYKTLKGIIERHETTVHKGWTKKSTKKSTKQRLAHQDG